MYVYVKKKARKTLTLTKYIKLTIDEEAKLKIAFIDFDKSIDTLAMRYGIQR